MRARARARASSLRGSVVRQQKLCGGGTTEENEQPRDVTPQSRDLLDTNAIANGKSLHCSIFHRGQKDACGEGIQEDETPRHCPAMAGQPATPVRVGMMDRGSCLASIWSANTCAELSAAAEQAQSRPGWSIGAGHRFRA